MFPSCPRRMQNAGHVIFFECVNRTFGTKENENPKMIRETHVFIEFHIIYGDTLSLPGLSSSAQMERTLPLVHHVSKEVGRKPVALSDRNRQQQPARSWGTGRRREDTTDVFSLLLSRRRPSCSSCLIFCLTLTRLQRCLLVQNVIHI